jgi:hypothetical protein
MPCRLLAGAMIAGRFLAMPLTAGAEATAPPARTEPCSTLIPQPEAERRVVMLRFERRETGLDANHYAQLAPVLGRLRGGPRAIVIVIVTITSHAERMAFEVARARAAAVRRAIMGQGIAARRIRVVRAGMVAGVDPQAVQMRVR